MKANSIDISLLKASPICIAMIKVSEVLKLKAYICPAGKWTIGWGHTGSVRPGQTITVDEAVNMLNDDVNFVEINLKHSLKNVKLTQGQFNALVDFTFNVGIGNFLSSTLYKLILNNPDDPKCALQFERWVYGGDGTHNQKDDDGDGLIDEPGEKLKLGGLCARRIAEKKLYIS